jgi:hypothetical protein
MKRFGEQDHAGPTVHAYALSSGRYQTGQFVWLQPVRILNVARWDDGDTTYDVRDLAGGGLVHVEATPPFMGFRVPNKGEIVRPYGMIRFDPDHGFWEIHPVRCWNPGDCVSLSVPYVRNGVPAGTPVGPGYYLQGGPVPLWVPLTINVAQPALARVR